MLFALACPERTAPLAKLDLRYRSVIPEGLQLSSLYPALNRPSVHLVYKAFTLGAGSGLPFKMLVSIRTFSRPTLFVQLLRQFKIRFSLMARK